MRNLNILGFVLVAAVSLSAAADEDREQGEEHHASDWQSLFDGQSAEQWRGYQQPELPSGWVIDEKSLCMNESTGDIMTRDKFADFELEFDWKVSEGGNSGVMYRVTEDESAPYLTGPEYQILDNDKHADGKSDLTSSGALYGLYATEKSATKPVGEWNESRIVLNRNHVEHWLNGKKMVDCEIGSDDWNDRLGKSKFASWDRFAKNRVGHIVFQDHGDKVWFRQVRVRQLDGAHGEQSEHHGHDDSDGHHHRDDGDGDHEQIQEAGRDAANGSDASE